MGLFQQFRALLWKCYIVRKRNGIVLGFEIVLPLILSALVTYLVAGIGSIVKNASNGTLPFDQNTGLQPATYYPDPTYNFPATLFDIFGSQSDQLYYTPRNNFTSAIAEEVRDLLLRRSTAQGTPINLQLMPFPDEESMVANYLNATGGASSSSWSMIKSPVAFYDTDDSTDIKRMSNLAYAIRPKASLTPQTSQLYPFKVGSAPRMDVPPSYGNNERYSGFITIQTLVNEAFLNLKAKAMGVTRVETVQLQAMRFPYPEYMNAKFSFIILVPFLVVFGFIITFPIIVKRIAEEKINKSREMFRMMGLSDWIYWSTNFLSYFILYAVQGSAMTLMFTVKWSGVFALINGANWFLVLIIFMLFGASFILFAMLVAVPFTRPVFGVVVSVVIWTVTFVLPLYFLDPTMNSSVDMIGTQNGRLLACLLPNFAVTMALRLIQQKEIYGGVADFTNLFEPVSVFGNLTLGVVMIMMLSSCFLMTFFIWYLDKVWPWQDGVPQPLWFPFTKAYWCARPSGDKNSVRPASSAKQGRYFERQMSSVQDAISIRGLKKKFGKKYAVDGIDMDIKHGQITCLLGHNGAGKTTTMSMITGMFPASEGKISVNGYDVATQTVEARSSMSLCPQHNVLYNELTVAEHMKLYAAIKGLPWDECEGAAIKQAESIQLGHCLTKQPGALSGGMKRKLSLGIALVGDTKVVILDEPTSGLDPEARRMIWDLLRLVRRERTILLTTHYMEEADALGDSIAIMTAGRISCYGTPMFLKKAFSTGYQLRVAKGINYDHSALERLVVNHFPKGCLKSQIDTEVIFALESEDGRTDSTKLPDFFREIEKRKNSLGVAAFGLSLTTLEDVFLKVGKMEEPQEDAGDEPDFRSGHTNGHTNGNFAKGSQDDVNGSPRESLDIDPSDSKPMRLTGSKLNVLRMKGLILKRFHFAKRYWPMLLFQIVLPSLTLGLSLWMTNSLLSHTDAPELKLSNMKGLYGSTKGFFKGDDAAQKKLLSSYRSAGESRGMTSSVLNSTEDIDSYLLDITNHTTINEYIKKHLVGAEVATQKDGRAYSVWYQFEAFHSLPAAINVMYEALLHEITGKDGSIDVTNKPIPQNNDYFGNTNPESLSYLWMILVPLSVPFLAASYVLFPIHERASKAKLLQLMTGLHPGLFWLASFLFDMMSHLLASLLIFIVFAILDTNKIFMYSAANAFALFILFVMCGLATIPLAYLASKMASKPQGGFAAVVVIYLVTGIVLSIAMIGNTAALQTSSMSQTTYDIVTWCFRISPIFSVSWGMKKVFKDGLMPSLCRRVPESILKDKCLPSLMPTDSLTPCCPEDICRRVGPDGKVYFDVCVKNINPLSWGDNGIGEEIFMMGIVFVACFLILSLAEYGLGYLGRRWHRRTLESEDRQGIVGQAPNMGYGANAGVAIVEDSDVVAEKYRADEIMTTGEGGDQEALVVKDLRRDFGQFMAVRGLSFGVHKQEIFGLLGVNGAGKTTTFRMLTGDLDPSVGDARSGLYSIVDSLSHFQQQLGYCPQFDALLDKLTGRESLFLFGRLRGIPEYVLKREVDDLVVMSDLTKHVDKPTEAYSGGNKRKLSLAMALIGSPKLLLLDEPTSGVDPGARRKIWTTLSKVRTQFGCSIILTSHSMEECEALCSRLAIMVNGQFQCLGSVQHLRNKYGLGFTVIIKLKREKLDTTADVQSHVQATIRGAVLRDAHETVIDYHVTDTSVTWTELFEAMESIKGTFDLEDYSVSDTTLEQIFISFARGQQAENKTS